LHRLPLSFLFTPPPPPAPSSLSLHAALPICPVRALTAAATRLAAGDFSASIPPGGAAEVGALARTMETMRRNLIDLTTTHGLHGDRKSTRLNSSHVAISYAVFCLKKKKKQSW